MAIRRAKGFTKPSPETIVNTTMVAPIKGVDARTPIGGMNPLNCIYTYNLMPAEYGMLLRPGFQEHQIAITGGASTGSRTIIPYTGDPNTTTDDRLFVCNNEGIWDVTVYDATPVLKVAFVTTTGNAGHGVFTNYTDQAGASFILFADSVNGLMVYTVSTDAWAVANPASYTGGLTTTAVRFVVVHKQRLWLIEDDNIGWYLPIASMIGACTKFYFGTKFPHGGTLLALINWSVDGGDGLDDYLVAVGSGGDVIPYQGADPSTAESAASPAGWASRGTYYIGRLPIGRRFFSEYSGDMYLLSSYGIISMSDLLRGVNAKDISADSMSFPIARLLREQLLLTSESLGWEIKFLPGEGQVTIASPVSVTTGQYVQYSMNLATQGWGFWRGVPMTSFTQWKENTYFCTEADKVYVMNVTRDYVLADKNDAAAQGAKIEFSILGPFGTASSPGRFKLGHIVRADWLSTSQLDYDIEIRYDYDLGELVSPSVSESLLSSAIFDTSNWDEALWAGAEGGYNSTLGVNGMGRSMAVIMRGTAGEGSRFVSWDIMWSVGGVL